MRIPASRRSGVAYSVPGRHQGDAGRGDKMVSRLLSFYATQLRVLWEWKGGRVALLKRLVITLVVATISFLATAWLLPRMIIDRPA